MNKKDRNKLVVLGVVAGFAAPLLIAQHAPGLLPDWVVPVVLGIIVLGGIIVFVLMNLAVGANMEREYRGRGFE